ncbi:MAG: hypothetical protein GF401_10140 [Chitinivibrionales bacterium]|nr:hypothetical protein [Chitinivibrionales bacterium]
MVKKTLYLSLFLVALTATILHAQVLGDPARTDLGVGTRALALGNNYTALANDASSLFWNPAGITFTKGSAFQFSFGGLRSQAFSEFHPGNTISMSESDISRLQVGNVAYVHNFIGRRNIAFGIAYQNPYAFDAVLGYSGTWMSGGNTVEIDNWYRSLGHLEFWTAGFGVRIIPEFAVGLALSLVTGHSDDQLEFRRTVNGEVVDPYNDNYIDEINRDYGGYDARLGFRFRPSDHFALGMRIDFPSYIAFSEWGSEVLPSALSESYDFTMDGYLTTYYSGAVGLAFTTPHTVLTAEVNARAPHPESIETELQRHWKVGAGAGIEIPFLFDCLTLRGGYAWKEYSPYPYNVHYDGFVEEDYAEETHSFNGEHMVSAGIAYTVAERVSLDLAVSHRVYELSTASVLEEKHESQRVLGAVSVGF